MSESLVEAIIFSIPEAVIIFCLASSLLGKKFTGARLAMMGIIFGTTTYLIREITGNFILTIVFSSIFIILLLKLFGSYDMFEAATTGLMAISLYMAIEFLNIKTLQVITGIDPTRLGEDFYLRILWFLPQILTAAGLSLIIRYFVNRQASRKSEMSKEKEYEDKYL